MLRIIVPFALAAGAIALAIAVAVNTTNNSNRNSGTTTSPPVTTTNTPPPAIASTDTPTTDTPTPTPTADAEPQTTTEPAQPTARATSPQAPQALPDNPALVGLYPRTYDAPDAPPSPLGSLDPKGSIKLFAEFDLRDAGISSLRLADGFVTSEAERDALAGNPIAPEDHIQVQGTITHNDFYLTPMAASSVTLGNQTIYLDYAPTGSVVWREITPGTFEAIIANDSDQDVARITRIFTLDPDSHNIHLEQRVDNLTDAPFTAQLVTTGLTDHPKDTLGYGGDKRRVRFGYLASPAIDPNRTVVSADAYLIPRRKTFGKRDATTGNYAPVAQVWPTLKGTEKEHDLVWLGVTSRYYAAILHKDLPDSVSLSDPNSSAIDRLFRDVVRVERVVINKPELKSGLFGNKTVNDPLMALSIVAQPMTVAQGGTASQSWGLYAGPLSQTKIRAEPIGAALGLDTIVVYNFGGPCSFCTFTWLTSPLRGLLDLLHSITYDWALSIILLVVVVRTLLHPVTRWSQIKMQRFGKQMQGMAPKQKKIQERYKDDPTKMREEMSKLWREEGISPAGFLGCLPMFLQSPVWIALYATLYFTYDLRHEPAFFGVFQNLTNHAWLFMGDLSEPDRAISFGGTGFSVPLMGSIQSFNILPLLLGAVFYVHQKYLTPPASAAMTPEQESQQKMMRLISVFMFPIFMYNAPSGLSLYFITNSLLAIFETKWIRAHMDKNDMLEPENLNKKKKKKVKSPPKPGSLRHRLAVALEEQQRQRALQDHRSPKREPRMAKPEQPERKYKKKR